MSGWKVHLIWGVLAVVGAAAWGQHVSSRKDLEFADERAALRRVRTVAPPATPSVEHAEPVPSSSESSGAREDPGGASAGAPPATPPRPELLSADQIVALLQTGNSKDGQI